MPLVSNLIEMVTTESSQPGQRHEGLTVGAVAIRTWPGQPLDPTNSFSGVKWIEGISWVPYQRASFVTPAFPGYISGHSTFSRAAAEVLTKITGTPFFPGGMGGFTAKALTYLSFEKGPNKDVPLQWATYYDAADQAGISRLYGGIHVSADDFTGRRVGSQCGLQAWELARKYFEGTIQPETGNVTVVASKDGTTRVRFDSSRGFYYRLQSTDDLALPFAELPDGIQAATDARLTITNRGGGAQRFFRIVAAPGR